MSADLKSIVEALDMARERHIFPGAAVGVVTAQRTEFVVTGRLTYDSSAAEVTPDTLYDVASVTKSIPTSLLATQLIDQGLLDPTDTLPKLLPEYQHSRAKQVTLGHLLDFRVEFGLSLSLLKELAATELKQRILTAPIISLDSKLVYQNTTSILLGWIIEKATQSNLEQVMKQQITDLLQCDATTFFPTRRRTQIAPSERDHWRNKEIVGEVHDESAWVLRNDAPLGSAGLFSTTEDLAEILQVLLQNYQGDYSRAKLLSRFAMQHYWRPQSLPSGQQFVSGWEYEAEWMGASGSKCMGKSGFTGCCIALDLAAGKAVVMLSNALYPHRPSSRLDLLSTRQAIVALALR